MYRLFVAAIAMMFSVGCHAVCKIFLVKSKLSTLMSSFLRLPPTQTLRGLRMARGLLLSREASRVTSRLVLRSNIRKKLLYAPVIITLQRDRGTTKAVKQQLVQSLQHDWGRTAKSDLRVSCLLVSDGKEKEKNPGKPQHSPEWIVFFYQCLPSIPQIMSAPWHLENRITRL